MIVWVDQRFSAWGTWVQMGRGLGSKGLSASWDGVGGGSARTTFVPIKDLECSRTDDWVRSLEKDQQMMLLQVYCTPATTRDHARILKISLRTLYARLHSIQAVYARHKDMRQIEARQHKMNYEQ